MMNSLGRSVSHCSRKNLSDDLVLFALFKMSFALSKSLFTAFAFAQITQHEFLSFSAFYCLFCLVC